MREELIPLTDFKPINNYERIKDMSLDEMAKWMWDEFECAGCAYTAGKCGGKKCLDGHKAWLEQEAE